MLPKELVRRLSVIAVGSTMMRVRPHKRITERNRAQTRYAPRVQISHIERREVWVVPAGKMGTYLEADFGWPVVQWMGQIRRYRRFLHQAEWDSVKTTFWIAGGKKAPAAFP